MILPQSATKFCTPAVYFANTNYLLDFSQMRQYLKVEEKYKEWENMEMKWIPHHNPDLVVLDDNGKEKERIDLQGLTASKLEQMLTQRGFKKK